MPDVERLHSKNLTVRYEMETDLTPTAAMAEERSVMTMWQIAYCRSNPDGYCWGVQTLNA